MKSHRCSITKFKPLKLTSLGTLVCLNDVWLTVPPLLKSLSNHEVFLFISNGGELYRQEKVEDSKESNSYDSRTPRSK